MLEAEILLRSKDTFVLECKKKKKKERQSIRFPSPRDPLCKGCARSMEGKIERPNQFCNRDQEIHLENSSLSRNRFRSVELHFLPFPFAAMRRRKRKGKGVYRGGRGSRLARVNSDTSGCYAVSAHLKWKCALRFSSLAGSSRLAPPFCFITRCDTSPWRHLGFHILFHSLIPSSTTPPDLYIPTRTVGSTASLLCYGILLLAEGGRGATSRTSKVSRYYPVSKRKRKNGGGGGGGGSWKEYERYERAGDRDKEIYRHEE